MEFREIFILDTDNTMSLAIKELEKCFPTAFVRIISSKDLLAIDNARRNQLFIMETFSGPEFESLDRTEASILGHMSVLQILTEKDVPLTPFHQILSFAMLGMVVKFSKTMRRPVQIEQSGFVYHLGGRITEDIKEATHFVTLNVSDPEILIAQDIVPKITIMKDTWAPAVLAAARKRILKASDEYFREFLCPPLYGLNIAMYKGNIEEQEQLIPVILSNGGNIVKLFDERCSHLLVLNDKDFEDILAKRPSHIEIVTKTWLFRCETEQSFQDPKQYQPVVGNKDVSSNSCGHDDMTEEEVTLAWKNLAEDAVECDTLRVLTDYTDVFNGSDRINGFSKEEHPSWHNREELKKMIIQSSNKHDGICVDPDDPLAEGLAGFMKTDPMVLPDPMVCGSPIPYPLASEDMTKDILQLIEKAFIRRQLSVGAKNAMIALQQNVAVLMVFAKDSNPTINSIVQLAMEKKVPYVFIQSKLALGEAIGYRRPMISCSVNKKDDSNLIETADNLLSDIWDLSFKI